MKIHRSQFKWWYAVIVGFANIGDGLIMIITLGYVSTSLSLRACLFGLKRNIYRKPKQEPVTV